MLITTSLIPHCRDCREVATALYEGFCFSCMSAQCWDMGSETEAGPHDSITVYFGGQWVESVLADRP